MAKSGKVSEHMVEEHAGGFLHVVGSCMEERVEGKIGALAEVIGIAGPRDGRLLADARSTVAKRAIGLLEGIETDADRGWLVESGEVLLPTGVAKEGTGIGYVIRRKHM